MGNVTDIGIKKPAVVAKPSITAKPTVATAAPNNAKAQPVNKGASIPFTNPPFMIRTKEDREAQRYLKVLIYGDFGVGKTYLAGSAAEVSAMNDVLLISAEAGELTLDTDEKCLAMENIDSVSVKDYKTMSEVYKFLKLHCKYRDLATPEAENKLKQLQSNLTGVPVDKITEVRHYRTVIIDSLTEIESYCMNMLLGVSDTTDLHEEVASAEWAEYKKQHQMVQRLVRAYRDLSMHVVFICSRTFIQDEQKRMLFSPSLTGKLSSQVQGFMDIVGYYVLGQPRDDGTIPRRLYVQPVGKFNAKCRFSNYKSAAFDDPTMGSILQKVGLLQTTK